MTSKHTPGPWQVAEPEDEYDTWLVLCSAPHEVAHIARRYTNGERNEAIEVENARLIAAAPDLLANLKFAVDLFSAMPVINGTAQIDRMRAAIALAEGR